MTRVTDPLRWHEERPALHEPVLLVMLTGWIDASGAAAAAMTLLDAACHARPLVTYDGDVFVDYRARRPTMSLREGVNVDLEWPEIVLKVGADLEGRDVLLLCGPEPDMAWHRFARLTADLAVELGVTSAVIPAGDLSNALRDEKLLTVAAGENVVRMLPPLIVSEAEIDEAVQRIERACAKLDGSAARRGAAE